MVVGDFVLDVEGGARLLGVGETLQREGFTCGRGQAGLQCFHIGVGGVKTVGELLNPGRSLGAQGLARLHIELPGFFVIGGVAHAVRRRIAPLETVVARIGGLVTQRGLQRVGQCGIQAELRVQAGAVAVHVLEGIKFPRGGGCVRRHREGGQAINLGTFLHMLQRQLVFLSGIGAQHHLAQQRAVAVALGVRCGAVDVFAVVGAHVVQRLGAAHIGGHQPAHHLVAPARHRAAGVPALVVAGVAHRRTATYCLAALEEIFRVVGDEVHQAGHAVGAVQRGRRAPDDFDPLHQPDVEIVAPERIGRKHVAARHPDAVDQRQHLVAVTAADVEARVAVRPRVGTRQRHTRRGTFDGHVGQVTGQVTDVTHLPFFQVFGADDVDGRGQVVTDLLAAGAADDHFLQVGRCHQLRLCRTGASPGQHQQPGELAHTKTGRDGRRSHCEAL